MKKIILSITLFFLVACGYENVGIYIETKSNYNLTCEHANVKYNIYRSYIIVHCSDIEIIVPANRIKVLIIKRNDVLDNRKNENLNKNKKGRDI